MAKVPKYKRPSDLIFVSEGVGDNTGGKFRCVSYRNPKAGDLYCYSPTEVVTAHCEKYEEAQVIVERVS